MKIVGLISGGKDSIYNLISCIEYGHEIVCLANLFPPQTDELNSHMFQTVGHEAVEMIAAAMDLPLIRRPLQGQSLNTTLHFETNSPDKSMSQDQSDPTKEQPDYDEIDDLYKLISQVKSEFPEIQGVAAGAILSNYQRIRVERICGKLGLTCYAYLWQRDQVSLLDEMCSSGKITPALIKLATPNLPPQDNLMKTLRELQPKFLDLFNQYGMNVCGEGGEYESLVLDSCLQSKRLNVTNFTIIDSTTLDLKGNPYEHLTVPYSRLDEITLVDKSAEDIAKGKASMFRPVLQLGCEAIPTVDSLTSTSCDCANRPTFPLIPTPQFANPLPSLHQQVQSNLKSIIPNQLISRVCLVSEDITKLFSAFKSLLVLASDLHIGLSLRPVFVMICIPDMKQFGAMNAQYSTVFPTVRPPARVCVQSALPYYTLDVILISTAGNHHNKLAQYIDSCHVEGVSTWAPANIGPYSQYWRLNGLFLGAGQIGMFPPTMALYTCVAKQFFQTLKNAVACLQSASELHSLNAKIHVARINDSYLTTTPSIGQFTSMLLTFDENQVLYVLDAVLVNHPQFAALSLAQKVEIFLSITNTLTAVPSTPIRSPDTNFDPIPIPLSATIPQPKSFSSTNGFLFNPDKESHMRISNQDRKSEIAAMVTYLQSHNITETPNTQNWYLPPIVTIFDSDYTLPVARGDDNQDNSSEDQCDKPQPHQLANSSSLMIFVSAGMLPRSAAFELCSVGLTNHAFKAMANRSSSSGLPQTLSQLRWIYLDPTTDTTWVLFAIFAPRLYLDFALFQLGSTSLVAGVGPVPPQLLAQLYEITKCYPSSCSNSIQSSLNIVQSQLFVPLLKVPDTIPIIPEAHTNVYPTTDLFDQLNLYTAKLYADSYLRLLHQKGKQLQAVNQFLQQEPTTSPQSLGQHEDFFYPRPAKATTPCLCAVLSAQTSQLEASCSICKIQAILATRTTVVQIYHSLLVDPNLLTDLDLV